MKTWISTATVTLSVFSLFPVFSEPFKQANENLGSVKDA